MALGSIVKIGVSLVLAMDGDRSDFEGANVDASCSVAWLLNVITLPAVIYYVQGQVVARRSILGYAAYIAGVSSFLIGVLRLTAYFHVEGATDVVDLVVGFDSNQFISLMPFVLRFVLRINFVAAAMVPIAYCAIAWTSSVYPTSVVRLRPLMGFLVCCIWFIMYAIERCLRMQFLRELEVQAELSRLRTATGQLAVVTPVADRKK